MGLVACCPGVLISRGSVGSHGEAGQGFATAVWESCQQRAVQCFSRVVCWLCSARIGLGWWVRRCCSDALVCLVDFLLEAANTAQHTHTHVHVHACAKLAVPVYTSALCLAHEKDTLLTHMLLIEVTAWWTVACLTGTCNQLHCVGQERPQVPTSWPATNSKGNCLAAGLRLGCVSPINYGVALL